MHGGGHQQLWKLSASIQEQVCMELCGPALSEGLGASTRHAPCCWVVLITHLNTWLTLRGCFKQPPSCTT